MSGNAETDPIGEVAEKLLRAYGERERMATDHIKKEDEFRDWVIKESEAEIEKIVREIKESDMSRDEIIRMYAVACVTDKALKGHRALSVMSAYIDDADSIEELLPEVHAVEQENIKNKKARKKGADARHKENRQLRDDAFKWLDANFTIGKTLDAHAEDLKAIIPVSFKTCRRWVGEWKRLPSASKG